MSVVTWSAARRSGRAAAPATQSREREVWDCLICGVQAIAASLRKCPVCHAQKGAEPVTEPEVPEVPEVPAEAVSVKPDAVTAPEAKEE